MPHDIEHNESNLETEQTELAADARDKPISIAPTLYLSPTASTAAKNFQIENPNWQTLPLRVYLSGKGCDGFDYGVCFDQQDPTDYHFTSDSVSLVCDPETFKFIAGSTIDFVNDERGRGFVVINPRHKQFRGKFYKRKGWEERLKI